MNKILLLLLIFTTLLLSIENKLDQQNTISFSPLEKEYLKNNPVIKLGYEAGFEPLYVVSQDGKLSGIVPELFDNISKVLNINLQ